MKEKQETPVDPVRALVAGFSKLPEKEQDRILEELTAYVALREQRHKEGR